jgi:diadenosine tetraphosphatase ApaH/serine/threonine PP2A family protein phosphatase
MRLAVLSDIHANLEALQAVLTEADAREADAVVCLGDVVGYGPDPGPCVDLVRERCEATVMGNHDAAVALGEGAETLPRDGQAAAALHRRLLTADQTAWVAGLPYAATAHGVTLVHASPERPAEWLRLDSFSAVQAQFAAFETAVCFVGHSHKPAVVSDTVGVTRVRPGHRYLINVGSVGQPRDHDPRAAFGLFDTEAVSYELVRVHYDLARTRMRIAEQGLPEALGGRLSVGV